MRIESFKLANEGPQKENICAVVVTYFPDENFSHRLSQVRPQVGHVVVVDNSSDDALEQAQASLSKPGIDVIRNSQNLGIATALNQGAQWALENGYSWALFLDQDTIPSQNMVEKLISAYEHFPRHSHLAVVGSKQSQNLQPNSREISARSWIESKTVITAGSLVSLEVLRIVGFFRDEFFIDCVDFDFCLRARSMGFEIIEVPVPVMQHFIGHPSTHRLPWAETETSNHVPWRWYYMTRNHLILWREYLWKDPAWVVRAIYSRIRVTLLMLLFEESKAVKIKYIVLGFYDGVVGRLGRNIV